MAVACAIAVTAASGAAVLSATDAGAALIQTKISLADFKAAYGLSSVRALFDNGNGRGTSLYIQRFNTEGKSFRKFGGKLDLSKSFIFFRVNAPPQTDPVSAAFTLRVQRGPFSANNEPVIETCTIGGSTSAGVNFVDLRQRPDGKPVLRVERSRSGGSTSRLPRDRVGACRGVGHSWVAGDPVAGDSQDLVVVLPASRHGRD